MNGFNHGMMRFVEKRIMMWLATAQYSFTKSTGGTLLPAVEYVDVGHATTSTNRIAVL